MKNKQLRCHQCDNEIESENEYRFQKKILCENCCMDMRIVKMRKTHWQYLTSIKTDYLHPGK